MKINVLVDESGKIIAAHNNALLTALIPISSERSVTRIKLSPDQSLYEVEIPIELQKHILENTLASEIFQYTIKSYNGVMKLVKAS